MKYLSRLKNIFVCLVRKYDFQCPAWISFFNLTIIELIDFKSISFSCVKSPGLVIPVFHNTIRINLTKCLNQSKLQIRQNNKIVTVL